MVQRYMVKEQGNTYQICYLPPRFVRFVLRLLRQEPSIPVSPVYPTKLKAWVTLVEILCDEQDARGALFAAEYCNLLLDKRKMQHVPEEPDG